MVVIFLVRGVRGGGCDNRRRRILESSGRPDLDVLPKGHLQTIHRRNRFHIISDLTGNHVDDPLLWFSGRSSLCTRNGVHMMIHCRRRLVILYNHTSWLPCGILCHRIIAVIDRSCCWVQTCFNYRENQKQARSVRGKWNLQQVPERCSRTTRFSWYRNCVELYWELTSVPHNRSRRGEKSVDHAGLVIDGIDDCLAISSCWLSKLVHCKWWRWGRRMHSTMFGLTEMRFVMRHDLSRSFGCWVSFSWMDFGGTSSL